MWKEIAVKQHFRMKAVLAVLALLLLVTVLAEKRTLLISTPESAKTTYPANKYTVFSTLHNNLKNNYLGYGPQWIWVNGDGNDPTATFEALFSADCPHSPASLIISPDDRFIIYFNGESIVNGGAYPTIYTYSINLHCGLNNLTLKVINTGGPGAVIFKVEQEQGNCFDRPGALYDYKTCSFQCSSNCSCPLGKHWTGFPSCKCKCNNPQPDKCNRDIQRFDERTCSCACITNICPPGLEQDSDSCRCRCKAKACAANQQWNYYSCSCEAAPCIKTACSYLKIWSQETCGCICPNNIACPSGQVLNPASCSCN